MPPRKAPYTYKVTWLDNNGQRRTYRFKSYADAQAFQKRTVRDFPKLNPVIVKM